MNLKFWEKLKVSTSINKYRYHVKIHINNWQNIQNYHLYNIEKNGSEVSFDCNKNTLKLLSNNNIEIEFIDRIKNTYLKNKTRLHISLVFILIILIIYSLNQFLIRSISFARNDYYDDEIYCYVMDNVKKIGTFYILEDSLSKISKNLRQEFYEYAYVGLSKKGSKLLIDVEIQEMPKIIVDNTTKYGEYLAKCDATIIEINLTSGKMIASYNDVVKKGDIIATSNLQYIENLYSKDKMVPLKGEIIGKTIYYETIKILKKENIEVFTNEVSKGYVFLKDNNEITKSKNPFDLSYDTTIKIISLGKISFVRKVYYEKKEELITRDYDEAYDLSKIKLQQNFISNTTSSKEKIVSLKLLKTEENNKFYTFKYMICAHQNIVSFRSFEQVSN